ncbi:MAG: hypothetical protein ABSG15_10540 [FCB group bacterium]|jgi:hypothetical protein
MEENKIITEQVKEAKIFPQRLDFYWKSISVYSIVFFVYLLLKGTIEGHTYTVVLMDPVVILLAVFIICSMIALLFQLYKKRTIIIAKDYIIFKNRFSERKFTSEEILKVSIRRQRLRRHRTRSIKIVKISVKNRRVPITIRTTSYWNARELVYELSKLKNIHQM